MSKDGGWAYRGRSHGEGCLVDGVRATQVTSLITSIAWNQRGFNPLPVPVTLLR